MRQPLLLVALITLGLSAQSNAGIFKRSAKPDPAKDETIYGADYSGTLIAIFPVTNETVLQGGLLFSDQNFLRLEVNTKLMPKEGTPVKLVIEVPAAK